jgi:hypothetical protein
MTNLNEFTNSYSLTKTLCFDLIPEAGTEQLVRDLFEQPEKKHHESIQKDLELSESYKKIKQLMDCRHRNIIDEVLSKFEFTEEELKTLFDKNINNDDNGGEDETHEDEDTEGKKDVFKQLREKLSKKLHEKANVMFDKKLLNTSSKNEKCDLEKWMDSADEKYLELNKNETIDKNARKEDLKRLKKFFTYFSGFNENRENVYSEKNISTAIPFRIINVNFPIFKNNMENYNKIKKEYPDLKKTIDEKGANEIFQLEYFNKCLTQNGIDVYNKEKLGIVAKKQGRKQESGINQIINEYVQKENKKIKDNTPKGEKPKKIKIATFDKLKKQILSINKTKSFQFEVFESTQEIIDGINKRYHFLTNSENSKTIKDEIKDYLENLGNFDLNYDLSEVYLNEKFISKLSKKLFGYGRYIEFALEKWCDDIINKHEKNNNKSEKNKKRFLSAKQFSIQLIHDSIQHYLNTYEQDISIKNKYVGKNNIIVEYFKNPTITIEVGIDNEKYKIFKESKEKIYTKQLEKNLYEEFENRWALLTKNILNNNYNKDIKEEKEVREDNDDIIQFIEKNKNILSPQAKEGDIQKQNDCLYELYQKQLQNSNDSEKVKAFLDVLREFNYILSPFTVKDEKIEKDEEFYNKRKYLQEELLFEAEILDIYNQTRNYITKKPYKLDKFRLMFGNPQFAGGWDKNKEQDYQSIILQKDGFYYLAIMEEKNKAVFEDNNLDIIKIEEKLKEERKKLTTIEDTFKKQKEGTKIFTSNKEKIKQYKESIEKISMTINALKNMSDFYTKVDYKYFKDCTTMIPKCSIQTQKVKGHFKKKSEDLVIEKNTSLSKNGERFIKKLVIPKEIFDLNNQVFDKDTSAFVPKKEKNETRPKKFQKKYLKQSKDQKGYLAAIKAWIQYCRYFLESYESTATAGYDYGDVFEKQYHDIASFYEELNGCIYRLIIDKKISAEYVEQLAQEGNVYLFKINNKDFNPGSTGKKNLHTLYWEMLFDPKNLEDVIFKLNGEAKLFYREASNIKNNTIHKSETKVAKKFFKLSDGILEPVPSESIKNLNKYFSGKLEKHKLTTIDLKYIDNCSTIGKKDKTNGKDGIVKDGRFTEDKIQFHCSITINFKSKNQKSIDDVLLPDILQDIMDGKEPKNQKSIDNDVLRFLHKRNDVYIIGLDRGERNLIYLTMINKEGKIVDGMQFSLNELERSCGAGDVQKIDYHKLLQTKEVSRTEARKNWQTVENIKNLKEGYLSLVIHQLAKLAVENNAIIVMENLNYGFKDSRANVEKQIYQKFENMLIRKLQYLVTDKDNLYNEGGIIKAYQLTNEKIPAYKYMGKQNGFLFYVPPDYTSKIDPVTGFVNLLDTRYTNRINAINFLNKFDKIYYDTQNKYFRFEFDYKNFSNRRIDVSKLNHTEWSVCSHPAQRAVVTRINNKWIRQQIDINSKLEELFKGQNIMDFDNGNCLKESICKVENAKFFEDLLKYLFVLLSLRHTWKDNDDVEHDVIISSVEKVKDSNEFYNSENETKKEKSDLPVDADANGAYNIARKGLWLLKKLDETDDKEKAIKAFNSLKQLKIEYEGEKKQKTKNTTKTDEFTSNSTADEETKGEKKKKKVSQWCPNIEWLNFAQKQE